MNNRIASIVAAIFCCMVLLCTPQVVQADGTSRLSIMTTVFPAYDFARTLAGDAADVRLLLPLGTESHSYEPTPQDIIAISEADLFIYVGGESDHWVETILSSLGDNTPQVFRLTDAVTMVAEEYTEAMEHDDHSHEADEQHEEHTPELDEHVWTSPKNAKLIVAALTDTLTALSPASEASFASNLQSYLDELTKLDQAFEAVVASGKRDLIIFGDRFPMRYFVDAYGLRYDAAFPGCSEDSEPNIRTLMTLIDEVQAQSIPVIFYIEFSSQKTADIIAEETGAKTLLFHSCHNLSYDEMQAGASYLSLMYSNVEALKEALNECL